MSRFCVCFAIALFAGCGQDKSGDEKGKDNDTNSAILREHEWGNFPAPEIAGKDTKGDPFSIRAHKGKVVMVDFWATWCGPCVAMIPHEKMLAERMEVQRKPFVVLGISADRQLSDLTTFERDRNIRWRNLLSGPNTIPEEYQVEVLPTIILIDHKGIVRYRFEGGGRETEQALDAAVEALVQSAEKK